MKIIRPDARLTHRLATIVVGAVVLAACGSAETATVDSVDGSAVSVEGSAVAQPSDAAKYTIESGDTLSDIANRAGVSLTDLVAANDWPDGVDHLIVPGDAINLPQGITAVAAPEAAAESADSNTSDSGADSAAAQTTNNAGSSADTTYLDLFLDQGIVYNPFSGDAVGGDINYAEPACNDAVAQVASFAAADGRSTASSVLASLQAAGGDVPANFALALDQWQSFTSNHVGTYGGPYRPVSRGQLDETTLRQVLVDPAAVDMLDAYTSIDLDMPDAYIDFLSQNCTYTGV